MGLTIASIPAAGAAELDGHYYLQGVMEVGSELHLHGDGSFEWFLAYGAVDQLADGRWAREGDRVVLTATPPAQDGPLLRVDAVFPWDETAEARLRDMEDDREGALAQERCPFLAVADAVSAPSMAGDSEVAQTERARQARESLAPVETARAVFETAAEAAMTARAYVETVMGDERLQQDARAQMALAIAAMEAYRANLALARDAHAAAGLPMPALAEPRIPQACGPLSTPDRRAAAEAQPGAGLGVVVGDPASGLRFSGIEVTFVFSDGHRESRTTNRGGWALLRPRANARLQRVTLRHDGEQAAATFEHTFDVDPARGDVIAIAFDSARLSPPAFERMTLRIDGAALIPTWPDGDERGRYVRE